ncbi:hypothetical protein L1987_64765 [Smallanthus sonchifolius]|uniref:Uncharacterized protein n=1 Tax=Smallanthus sonchifolius TaxID=185202 RepID=A0ACB9BSN5_9ASTR|nr:hypothetical protein L1987_64765 [Smallanthus sonchifolius]
MLGSPSTWLSSTEMEKLVQGKRLRGKRHRTNSLDADPFDLNSLLSGSQSDESGDLIPGTCNRLVVDSCRRSDSWVPIEGEDSSRVSEEIEATVAMGRELGVNFENFKDMVRKVIHGEMELDVAQ